jgi:hypothetical protein
MAVAAVILGVFFWRRRDELPPVSARPSMWQVET